MNETTQYKLEAEVNLGNDTFLHVESDWRLEPYRVVEAMQQLQDDGHLAEVRTREIGCTTDPDDVEAQRRG